MHVIPQDTKNGMEQSFLDKASNAKGNRFNLVIWEVNHFPKKWANKILKSISPGSKNKDSENQLVLKYIQLNRQINKLDSSNFNLKSTIHERDLITNEVEEIIESRINKVLAEKNLATWGKITFPPVDINLGDTPNVLITSPRNKIFRLNDVLINPNISDEESDMLEKSIMREENLSALVSKIGGIATYPSAIPHGVSLNKILTITAHEWFHHYAFFHPLGQNMHNSNSLKTLNETIATLFGEEIANLAKDSIESNFELAQTPKIQTPNKFDFNYEMKITRLETESRLAKNKIADAEE